MFLTRQAAADTNCPESSAVEQLYRAAIWHAVCLQASDQRWLRGESMRSADTLMQLAKLSSSYTTTTSICPCCPPTVELL